MTKFGDISADGQTDKQTQVEIDFNELGQWTIESTSTCLLTCLLLKYKAKVGKKNPGRLRWHQCQMLR